MPLVRYFVVMGGVLLSLMFLSDSYLPKPAAAPPAADIDRSTIRVQSSRKWPDAIRIDTSAVVPPPSSVAAGGPFENERAASTRDAYAAALPRQPASISASDRPETPKKTARHAKAGGRAIPRYAVRRVANYQPGEFRGWPQDGW